MSAVAQSEHGDRARPFPFSGVKRPLREDVSMSAIGRGPYTSIHDALANKLARIAWGVLAHGRAFETSKLRVA